jgi:hypothetical protein
MAGAVTLPPYRPGAAVCVKCGLDEEPGTRYVPPGGYEQTSSGQVAWGECLVRSCRRCGYSWTEAVLTPAAPSDAPQDYPG